MRCAFSDFGNMQSALDERGIEPKSSEGEYLPKNTTDLTDEQIEQVLVLVDRLEQDEDVQNVFHTLA
ncbi:MAG: transcriptional/translational regulatory protein YebC/TACO1 [Kiritimatiellia bacterium]|jgi:transcriptional/translational regulatory protein YebC/TACO1